MKKVNLAIVGATGMVGRTFLQVLEEREFPIENLYLFSSEKSAGTEIIFREKEHFNTPKFIIQVNEI
jgi:aspartate-semialdehyde dehydrogenase